MMSMQEELKAIKIVKQLNQDKYQLYEKLYGGGESTLMKAFQEVMAENDVSSIDISLDMRAIHCEYEMEILNKYEELIELGREKMIFHEKVGSLLREMTKSM